MLKSRLTPQHILYFFGKMVKLDLSQLSQHFIPDNLCFSQFFSVPKRLTPIISSLPPTAIAQCTIQVLQPLTIRGTCRIQRLPSVSLLDPNFGATPGHDECNNDHVPNVKLTEIVYETGPVQMAAEHIPHPDQPSVTVNQPEPGPARTDGLQITVTSTESYGTETETDEKTQTLSSTLTTSKTDDEKIIKSRRQAKAQKSVKIAKQPVSAGKEDDKTLRVMQLIEEIFESSTSDVPAIHSPPPTRRKPTPAVLNFTHDSFHIASAEPIVQHAVAIQTSPTLSPNLNQPSALPTVRSGVSVSCSPPTTADECRLDIADASDEHVRITGEVFAAIIERKAARYLHQRGDRCWHAEAAKPASLPPSAPPFALPSDRPKLNDLVSRSLSHTFARYPDLRKHFVADGEHADEQSNAVRPPPAGPLPSERMQNLRQLRNLRQLQHEQLLAQHPRVQHTIDAIRRDASQIRSSSSRHSQSNALSVSYRSEHGADEIQRAAQRFLQSMRSPQRRQSHSSDAVVTSDLLLTAGLHSSTDTSASDNGDLFCTESSLKSTSSLLGNEVPADRVKPVPMATVTATTVTTDSTNTESTPDDNGADDDDSVMLSPLKLSTSLQTTTAMTTTTASEKSRAVVADYPSTSSSLARHMEGL